MGTETGGILTPDRRLRVYVSAVEEEMAAERQAVRDAVDALRLSPVLVELGARPYSPRALAGAYIEQSDIFVGVYWQECGGRDPSAGTARLADEYVASRDKPRLLYVKTPAPHRQPDLTALIDRIETDGGGSYRAFNTAAELGELVRDDLAVLLSERFSAADHAGDAGTPRLPVPVTALVGRERELQEVRALLAGDGVRLVTLTGPGGIGKTRLALELAGALGPLFPGGVAYAPLAGVREGSLVMPAVASALGAPIEGRQSPLDAIATYVRQPCLVVADNLEQIRDVGRPVADLLAATPLVTILATTRTGLRIRGEHEYPVPPLPVASVLPDRPPPAVELFVERAQAARPGFTVTRENADVIAEICRRLDGLPLAIELAAARVRLLQPDALLARLGNRLDLLTAGPSDLPERQRTLRATLAWSFDLLDPRAADVLAELSVFVDGWTLEAAAVVCRMDDLEELEALDGLIGHSLVVPPPDGTTTRFRMLQTVREFAGERLARRTDADDVRARHAAFFTRLLDTAEPGYRGAEQATWGERLRVEQGNVRATLEWHLGRGDIDVTAHLLRAVWPFWWLNDQLVEAQDWVERARRHIDSAGDRARAELLWVAWATALQRGHNDDTVRYMREGSTLIRSVGDPYLAATALLLEAFSLPLVGDLDGALRAIEAGFERLQALGEHYLSALSLSGLGTLHHMRGDLVQARRAQEQSLELGRRLGADRIVAQALNQLGLLALAEGRLDKARELIDASAETAMVLQGSEQVGLVLSAYSWLAAAENDLHRAAVTRGAAQEIRRRVGLQAWPAIQQAEKDMGDRIRSRMGDEAFRQACAEGARMTAVEAIALAQRRPAPRR